jgi:hypothetical protein
VPTPSDYASQDGSADGVEACEDRSASACGPDRRAATGRVRHTELDHSACSSPAPRSARRLGEPGVPRFAPHLRCVTALCRPVTPVRLSFLVNELGHLLDGPARGRHARSPSSTQG